MDASIFQPDAPGRLVPTIALDDRRVAGRIEKITVSGVAFVPDPLPPKIDWVSVLGAIACDLALAERNLAKLDGRATQLPNPDLLLRPFWRREARLSSQIEDTIATPAEVVLSEAGASGGREESYDVVRYISALRHGLSADHLPLVNRLFKEMHRVLMTSPVGARDLPGEFRREQNYIGNRSRGFARARFVPPPAGEALELCMRQLEEFMNNPPPHIPDLVAVALGHYQFECIHPFRDGNGRLGRLIVVLSLCRRGLLTQPWLYPSEFFDKHKDEYTDLLLKVSTHGAWEDWIRFVLAAIATQAGDALSRVDKLLSLRSQLIGQTKDGSTRMRGRELVEYLFVSPAVTVPMVAKNLGVSQQAARNYIAAFVEKNILKEVGRFGKVQYYLAEAIVDAVESDELPDGQD